VEIIRGGWDEKILAIQENGGLFSNFPAIHPKVKTHNFLEREIVRND
jgi:hypothetical protein